MVEYALLAGRTYLPRSSLVLLISVRGITKILISICAPSWTGSVRIVRPAVAACLVRNVLRDIKHLLEQIREALRNVTHFRWVLHRKKKVNNADHSAVKMSRWLIRAIQRHVYNAKRLAQILIRPRPPAVSYRCYVHNGTLKMSPSIQKCRSGVKLSTSGEMGMMYAFYQSLEKRYIWTN